MQFLISYFYQVRNLEHFMIPFSTAVWDPKWFHANQKDDFFVFKDRRGIYNGLRANDLVPGRACRDKCRGPETCSCTSERCDFLRLYREQLNAIDFTRFKASLECTALEIWEDEGFLHKPVIVLLVYEKPNNPCSERHAIISWFRRNDVQLYEFEPGKLY